MVLIKEVDRELIEIAKIVLILEFLDFVSLFFGLLV